MMDETFWAACSRPAAPCGTPPPSGPSPHDEICLLDPSDFQPDRLCKGLSGSWRGWLALGRVLAGPLPGMC